MLCVQTPSLIPSGIMANIGTVLCHRIPEKADKDVIAAQFNWANMIGQHIREIRYLGEQPVGFCVARLEPQQHFLEAAPVMVKVEPNEALVEPPEEWLEAHNKRK